MPIILRHYDSDLHVRLADYIRCGLLLAAWAGTAQPALAQVPASWSLVDVDCGLQVLGQSIVQATNRTPAAENFQLLAGDGTQAFAVRSIAATPVISELNIRVPLRASQAGLQVYVRVVLPRSPQQDQAPATLLIPGPQYAAVTEWETLELTGLPQALERQLRVARSAGATVLDAREAFVDMVLVNVYGGRGHSEVSLGVPEVMGAAIRRTPAETELAQIGPRAAKPPCGLRASGPLITIDGRPFALRAVHPRGESWEFLKQLGFNTVWLGAPPTTAQLAQADAEGLWIVAPPPPTIFSSAGDDDVLFRRVVAWDLSLAGSASAQAELAHRLRDGFGTRCRPLVCRPPDATSQSQADRGADVLVHQRPVLGTTMSLAGYRNWLQRRVDNCLPGALHWASLTTEYPASLLAQMSGQAAALHGGRAVPLAVVAEPAQLRRMAVTAVATGIRGVVVQETTRLDQPDPTSRLRAAAVAHLNHQLGMLQPWITRSHSIRWQPTQHAAVEFAVFELPRGSLAVPVVFDAGDSWRSCPAPTAPCALTFSTASDDAQAYALHNYGLIKLTCQRVAGGVRCQPIAVSQAMAILVTAHHRLAQEVAAHLERNGQEAIRNQQQIAQLLLAQTESTAAACADQQSAVPASSELDVARQNLRKSIDALQRGDLRPADQWATRSLESLTHCRHATWEAFHGSHTAATCPLVSCFPTLPWYLAWNKTYPPSARGVNLLAGGDFESAAAFAQSGWTVQGGGQPTHQAVSLVFSDRPGKCLRLRVEPGAAVTDNQPLVSVATPSVPVAAGRPVRIDGWIRVVSHPSGQPSRATIADSWTGSELRQQFAAGGGWQRFTMHRVGTGKPLSVTIALHAAGEVLLDEVQVVPLSIDHAPRLVQNTHQRP